jgi:hypothetical protein
MLSVFRQKAGNKIANILNLLALLKSAIRVRSRLTFKHLISSFSHCSRQLESKARAVIISLEILQKTKRSENNRVREMVRPVYNEA